MSNPLLERITLQFPGTHPEFHSRLLSLLAGIGNSASGKLELAVSDQNYHPLLSIDFRSPSPDPAAAFEFSRGTHMVRIENITGAVKQNPLPYKLLSIGEVSRRFTAAAWKTAGCDHIGFNLPWFGPGIHPRILELRKKLAGGCLYHRYPSGEPWDFILPGDPDEISGRRPVDYAKTRRPKFEIVSFDGASTPLIQIDICVNDRYEGFTRQFPEALADPQFHNIWIYLENPFSIDVCLVVNELFQADWSGHFHGCRI
jgi:hypothetical protein